jgi:PAS domain S-box-containing protein
MKVLYLANQRRVAEIAARGLYSITPVAAITWVRTHNAAVSWVQANRDAAVILAETGLHDQEAALFVERIRALGLLIPIVLILPAQSAAPAAALTAGADGYVDDGPSLEIDLPRIVTAAIERVRARRDLFVRKLTDLEARHAEVVQRLASAEESRRQTEERATTELAATAARLAAVQAQHTASLVREAKVCASLQERLFELEAKLRDANDQRAVESTAAAEQLVRRHAEFTANLAAAAETREILANRLSDATAALDEARRARAADAAAAAAHLATREAELGVALQHAAAGRAALERALSDAHVAAVEAGHRAAAELASVSQRQAALEERLAREDDARTVIERDLAVAQAARQDLEQQYASELAAAAMQLAEAQSRGDTAVTESAKLARREADLVETLAAETIARGAVEQDLAASRTESAKARQRFLHAISAHRRRTRAARTLLETQLAGARADADRQLEARDEAIRHLHSERDTLRDSLGAAQEQVQLLQTTIEEDRQGHDRARLASESELDRLSSEADRLRTSLDQVHHAFQELDQIAGAHAVERARLDKVVAERDAALAAETARHLAEKQAAERAFDEREASMRLALDASSRDVGRLHHETATLADELDAVRATANALRADAERLPALEAALETTRKASRRQFERLPCGLCECTRDGIITRVNHSFARLLGYRNTDELFGANLAKMAPGRPDDLRWLIDRAARSGKTETAESTWKPKNRPRQVLRLQALATTNDSLEIVVEDVTHLRALEDRLRRSQRMEAVGRLAAEIGVTCDTLLRDVASDGERWVAGIGSDAATRHGVGQLLADVRRARTVLQRFVVFAKEQTRALEPVSLPRVLRDLQPVLQQVVGDDIRFAFPRTSGSFEVDVDAQRVERLFVNIARYARERMPHGGQVSVDLSTTVVGARLIGRYSNLRRGPHVLMTVAEVGRADGDHHADGDRSAADDPGVDVGGLAELIADCGGHLWIQAERSGSLLLKIHLPQRADADHDGSDAVVVPRPSRGGRLTQWLRGKSEAFSKT